MITIARPPAAEKALVFAWPDRRIPLPAELHCSATESALFFKDKRAAGLLGPGRHAIDPAVIPSLAPIVEKTQDASTLVAEVLFVPNGDVMLPVSNGLGVILDEEFFESYEAKFSAELVLRVKDSFRLGTFVIGLGHDTDFNDAFVQWLSGFMANAMRTAYGELSSGRRTSLVRLVDWEFKLALAPRFLHWMGTDLEPLGLEVVSVPALSITIEAAARKRLLEKIVGERVLACVSCGGYALKFCVDCGKSTDGRGRCNACGERMAETAKFCAACGAPNKA